MQQSFRAVLATNARGALPLGSMAPAARVLGCAENRGWGRSGLHLAVRWLCGLLSCLFLSAGAAPSAWAQGASAAPGKRVALVIGNAAYADAPLRNPVNDATDLATKLRALGFDVTTATDRNRTQMNQAILAFGRAAQGADAALFYFAGHGVQIRGKNFLLPTGQRFVEEAEVETDGVDVNTVLARMEEAAPKVSLLILDACRTAPLQRRGRNTGRGLARMDAPSGALIAFAAQPGAEAQDGSGRNGTFTKHLLAHMDTPGLPVEQLFKRVRAEVERETQRAQSPREESSLTADFYFRNPFAPVTPDNRAQIEDEAWGLCRSATTVVPCEDYLSGWPQGRYRGLAQTRLRELRAQAAVPAVQPGAAPAVAAPAAAGPPVAGSELKDCEDCPTLVVLPRGSFSMGSPDSEVGRDADEGPVRQVTIAYGLAVGKYEVSVGEFGRFVQATGYRTEAERDVGSAGCAVWAGSKWEYTAGRNWRSPGFSQTESHPVVCVSWNDAQEYLKWLNGRASGKGFRLLSEAEWEYAARAGQGARRYPWGDDAGASEQCGYANGMDATGKAQVPGVTWTVANCSDGHAYTAPGNALRANAFGLHHMHGNALEWVQDVWRDNYQGSPADGAAWTQGGDQARRVLRGGSWNDDPRGLRSANRIRYSPVNRDSNTGFRIARTF